MKRIFVITCLMIGTMLIGISTVSADDAVPTSKCVTDATEATNAKALAQMEKDIEPYKKDVKAALVIEEYSQNLKTAWEAMQQPYCGYGAYGSASAVKSFSKSISRARATFLGKIKNPGNAAVSLMKQEVVHESVSSSVSSSSAQVKANKKTASNTTPKSKTATPKATSIPASTTSATFSGLHKGMRSEAVKVLQKKLAEHFGISQTGFVTGYFGPKTQERMIKFQLEKGLISSSTSPAAGHIGPKTIKALSEI